MPELPLENYFGDGRDGVLNTTGNVSFPVDVDGPTVFKYYTSIRINAGHTVTPANRCKGMVIYCLGDCIIDGTLSMTARGANAPGELFKPNDLDKILTYNGYEDFSVAANGGAGGTSGIYSHWSLWSNAGANGSNGACGGGGAGMFQNGADAGGGTYEDARGGYGAAGTSWSGGSGGGGAGSEGGANNGKGGHAVTNGGRGGNGWSGGERAGSGGAGNPGGSGGYSSRTGEDGVAGANGTGGLLILIVRGNLIINSTGAIRSQGSSGGIASNGRHGGGSGGGGITLLYGGSYQKLGTISNSGGGGARAGGSGSLRIAKIKAIELPRQFRPLVIDALGSMSELPKNYKMNASVGIWFGNEPLDHDSYPFYYNLSEEKLYFYSDETGTGDGFYVPISQPDASKMDKAVYDAASGERQVAFEDQIHHHPRLDLLNQIIEELVDSIHHHNNLTQLESFTEARVATLAKLSEYEGQPTWNNLAWPVGNPASTGAALWISDTPPSDPQNFPFWWSTAELQLYVYHVDGDSSQYVEANPIRHGKDGVDGLDGLNGRDGVDGAPGRDGLNGLDGANRLWVGSDIPANPVSYPFWWNPIEGRFLIWYETDSCYVEANPVVHGVDGQDGVNGTNGVDGQDGADGLDGDNKIWVGTEIPSNPETYPFWWNPVEGRLLIWYTTANAYVEANPVVHGIDGQDGVNGIGGIDGKDGKDGLDGANRLWTQPDAPANPTTYPFWWNPDDGRLRIYYEDGDSGQYVDANPVVHGVDGRDGIDGVDGAPGADGAPGGIQSFPSGKYLRKHILSIDENQYSFGTTWVIGPAWGPIPDFLPNSIIRFAISFFALKNSTTGWGGIYLEPQVRFNSGPWLSLGCSGYATIMYSGTNFYNRYYQDYVVEGLDIPFSFEVRTAVRSHAGNVQIQNYAGNGSLSAVSGLASGLITPNQYARQHLTRLLVEEYAPFPQG